MSNIVEVREMSTDKLEKMLEESREEAFNLRFQRASGQLEDYSRLRKTRQDIARLETLLTERKRAIAVATADASIMTALEGKEWKADVRFDYELSTWVVNFMDDQDQPLTTAHVNLNKKQAMTRRDRQSGKKQPKLVTLK